MHVQSKTSLLDWLVSVSTNSGGDGEGNEEEELIWLLLLLLMMMLFVVADTVREWALSIWWTFRSLKSSWMIYIYNRINPL